jgi:prepilin-type N-terminal cleavage/methylation domain-containing protein
VDQIFKTEDGFTLIELLIAITISSIVILTFNTIILSSYQLYEKSLDGIEKSQKSMLFTSWLKTKVDNSSSSFVSTNDNLFTIREKGSNHVLKLTLYESQGKPAIGLEKYQYQDNILSYIEKEPIVNGVTDLDITEVPINKDYKYFYLDLVFDDKRNYNSIIY